MMMVLEVYAILGRGEEFAMYSAEGVWVLEMVVEITSQGDAVHLSQGAMEDAACLCMRAMEEQSHRFTDCLSQKAMGEQTSSLVKDYMGEEKG